MKTLYFLHVCYALVDVAFELFDQRGFAILVFVVLQDSPIILALLDRIQEMQQVADLVPLETPDRIFVRVFIGQSMFVVKQFLFDDNYNGRRRGGGC